MGGTLMHGTSALLIDLENYIRRTNKAAIDRGQPMDKGGLAIDIRNEITYLKKLAFDATAGRRLIVQRAYADFRVKILMGKGDYNPPNILMDMGIEPVQVYAFGGRPKNRKNNRRTRPTCVLSLM
jgi:hypothetical protein